MMKTLLLLLLIPVVSATCFYLGSYVFPNKETKDIIHLKTEKVNAEDEPSPLVLGLKVLMKKPLKSTLKTFKTLFLKLYKNKNFEFKKCLKSNRRDSKISLIR